MSFSDICKCFYCGEPVDPRKRDTYRRIVGWERKTGTRTSGKKGGSDISLREARDEYAHSYCVSRVKDGTNVKQETLV